MLFCRRQDINGKRLGGIPQHLSTKAFKPIFSLTLFFYLYTQMQACMCIYSLHMRTHNHSCVHCHKRLCVRVSFCVCAYLKMCVCEWWQEETQLSHTVVPLCAVVVDLLLFCRRQDGNRKWLGGMPESSSVQNHYSQFSLSNSLLYNACAHAGTRTHKHVHTNTHTVNAHIKRIQKKMCPHTHCGMKEKEKENPFHLGVLGCDLARCRECSKMSRCTLTSAVVYCILYMFECK